MRVRPQWQTLGAGLVLLAACEETPLARRHGDATGARTSDTSSDTPQGPEAPDLRGPGATFDGQRPPIDGPRPDAARPDAARPDAAHSDVAHPDAARTDATHPDATRPDPHSDATHPDATHRDGTHPDATHRDGAHPDAARPDGAHPDAARPDGPHPDAARPDGPHPDAVHPDAFPGGLEAGPVSGDLRARDARFDDLGLDARLADSAIDLALPDVPPPPPPPPFDASAGDLLGPPRMPAQGPPRVVILMIGDGMGPAHLDAARAWLGRPLNMESRLPFHGHLITSSLDGVTDSAAAATTLGSGVPTDNHFLGLDGEGVRVTVGVEWAHAVGARAGLVSTASLPHATPAGFASHARSRYDYLHIAESMVRSQPEVMLGGGRLYFWPRGLSSQRRDSGLVQPLVDIGYTVATTAAELGAAQPDERGRLLGLFAAEHLTYVVDRAQDTTEPTLAEMTEKALAVLSPAPGGFFLMIEGAKIDLASHANQLSRMVPEVVAFDEAVGVVLDWAAGRVNTTVIVTADHETGELSVTQDRGPGQLPGVRWRRGSHSNRPVDVFGAGDSAAVFDGQTLPNRWVHAVLSAGLTGEAVQPPADFLLPDGRFDDLAPVGTQDRTSDFGPGLDELNGLWAGLDLVGLNLGLEGLFERGRNSVTLLLDVDFGAGTGLTTFAGVLTDLTGRADTVLSHLAWDAAGVEGLGFDRAVVVFGGLDVPRDSRSADAGLRGFSPPENLPAFGVPVVFGEGTRPEGLPAPRVPGEGMETNLRWRDLFGAAGFPRGARVAVFATLTNDDGTSTSNQCLPPLPADALNPAGRPVGNPIAVPGVYVLNLDTDLDAVPDPWPTIELVPARPGAAP